MLQLALSLVLASSPSPVDGWAQQACPAPAQPPASSLEYTAQEAARTECLKRAMNRALDKTLRPLRRQGAAGLREWMGLQADYNRWMADACAAVEEARWVDLASGQRGMGSGYGVAENQCLQQQYAWRGFFADALARGDGRALEEALAGFLQAAPPRREASRVYQRLTQDVAARAPAQVPEAEAASPARALSQEDWRHYTARLERAAAGPEALARRQCALLASPLTDCEARLGDSLVAQLDFPAAPTPEVSGEPSGGAGGR